MNYYAQVKQALYGIIKRFSDRAPSLGQILAEAQVPFLSSSTYLALSSSSFLQLFLQQPF